MSSKQYAARGPLWADLKREPDNTIPLWLAFLVAAILELGIFAAVFLVDWTDEYGVEEPPPMTVELVKPEAPKEEPKPEPIKPPEPPPPEPPKPIPKPEPKPIPKVQAPKMEVKPEPKREPKIVIPESEPEDEPEDEAQPEPEDEPQDEPPPEPVPEPIVAPPPAPEPVKEELKVEQKEQIAPPKQVRNAKPLRKVAAAYPRSALKKGTTGKVKARLTVGDGGDVIDVEILESSPAGVFDDAVTKALKQYRFEADGSKYFVDQEVVFKLED